LLYKIFASDFGSFLTCTLHKVAYQCTSGVVGSLMGISLRVYYRVRRWKNSKNWSTLGKVMGKSRVSCFFLTHKVVTLLHKI